MTFSLLHTARIILNDQKKIRISFAQDFFSSQAQIHMIDVRKRFFFQKQSIFFSEADLVKLSSTSSLTSLQELGVNKALKFEMISKDYFQLNKLLILAMEHVLVLFKIKQLVIRISFVYSKH